MIALEHVTFRYAEMEMRFDVHFPTASFTAVKSPKRLVTVRNSMTYGDSFTLPRGKHIS